MFFQSHLAHQQKMSFVLKIHELQQLWCCKQKFGLLFKSDSFFSANCNCSSRLNCTWQERVDVCDGCGIPGKSCNDFP